MRISLLTLILPLLAVLASCESDSAMSPEIIVTEPAGFTDTIRVLQRFPLPLKLQLSDRAGLQSYTLRINNSIQTPKAIAGEVYLWSYDSTFRNAGIYRMVLSVTNTKGLKSEIHIPVRADSIRRASLIINGSEGTAFSKDSSVTSGQSLQFTVIAMRGYLPMDSIIISSSDNKIPLASYCLRENPASADSSAIVFISEPVTAESIFSFTAKDSLGLSTTKQLKVSVKK